jgi:hypothetical protein
MAKKPASPWSAVSIVCTSASCAAAQALKGQRYLSADAPRLPLSDCTSADACPCVYRKHPDRRAGPRREADTTGLRRSGPTPERRSSRGRRSSDH